MSSINYNKLSTLAEFKAAANSLFKRNMSAKRDMQSALMCAVTHMHNHGDYDRMVALLGVGASFGKNLDVALQEWVLKYTWLTLDPKSKEWSKDKTKTMDVEGAAAQEWWTCERAGKAQPYDFQKALNALFDGLAKELAKPDTTLDKNTVFSGIETKLRDILPVEDQIATLFDRVPLLDQNAIILQLMAAMPQVEVQSAATEVEPIAEAA